MNEGSDQTKLTGIWRRFSGQLRLFIRSRVPDDASAEDLLQEVFLRIHGGICCLKEEERVESWVYQITRNTIIDFYRSRRTSEDLPEDLAVEMEADEGEDSPAELAPYLREVVQALPEPYRAALMLTVYEGLNQRELADRLNISFSGAKSRVQRAREKVREILLSCCHLELDRCGRVIDYQERCCCCGEVIPRF
ncbi:MAG: RNA polymerase sigma factor SigZ [bacterium]